MVGKGKVGGGWSWGGEGSEGRRGGGEGMCCSAVLSACRRGRGLCGERRASFATFFVPIDRRTLCDLSARTTPPPPPPTYPPCSSTPPSTDDRTSFFFFFFFF
jgi:hypothetical protein